MYRLPFSSVKTTTGKLVSRTLTSNPYLVSRAALKPTSRSPFALSLSSRRHINMDSKELKAFFADAPPSVVRLEIAKHFDALTDKQKRYAHYIAK